MPIKGAAGKLILLDEVDALLVDKKLVIKPYQGGYTSWVIGLTATGMNDMHPLEYEFFKELHYHQIDSQLRAEYRLEETPKFASLKDFYGERFNGTVRLIYADKSMKEELVAKAKACGYKDEEIHVDLDVIAQLRQLRAPQFLLVTKPAGMRGLDYRSEGPITLFLAKLCYSKRALVQAFGRVGRYARDRCNRLVDVALRSDKVRNPMEFIDRVIVTKRAAELGSYVVEHNLELEKSRKQAVQKQVPQGKTVKTPVISVQSATVGGRQVALVQAWKLKDAQ